MDIYEEYQEFRKKIIEKHNLSAIADENYIRLFIAEKLNQIIKKCNLTCPYQKEGLCRYKGNGDCFVPD